MSVLTPVDPADFDISKLQFGHPMPGTAKNDPKVNFHTMSVSYGEEGEDSKLVLQIPFVKCTGLIESDQNPSGSPKDPTMYMTLNPSKPEENRVIEIMNQIYERACEEYCKHKVKFGKRSENDIVLRSQVTKLLKDAKYDAGSYVVSVKVPHWASIIYPKDQEPVPVDHRILRDVETVQAPLLVFSRFFIGSKVSLQFALKESVLRSVKERKRRILSRAQFDSVANDPDALEADSVLTRLAQQLKSEAGSSSADADASGGAGASDLASLIGGEDVQVQRGVKRTRGVAASAAVAEEAYDECDDIDVDERSVRARMAPPSSAAAAAGGARELLRRQPGRG